MSDKVVFGDVVRKFFPYFIEAHNPCVRKKEVLTNLSRCGTEEMGRCSYHCWDCEHEDSFNLSCRNRHCPSCHTHRKEHWLEARMRELLPVQYFHVVFTIPDILHPAMMGHMKDGYNALFKAAAETLQEFGKTKGVQLGMTMVLHTWGSNMSYHPHVHVLVPGGGIDLKTGKWVHLHPDTSYSKNVNSDENYEPPIPFEDSDEEDGKQPFLFPVKALSVMFRAKFIEYFTAFCGRDALDRETREECFHKGFVVFAKAPAAGPEQVLEYLARYSYGIAISNSRIIGIDGDDVIFRYKDYRDDGKSKEMRLDGVEFLRRFSMHILPKQFTRIRHFGFLAPSNREKLKRVQQELSLVSNKTLLSPKQRDKNVLRHGICCENCNSRNLNISIGFIKKNPDASVVPKIRSPAPLGVAV